MTPTCSTGGVLIAGWGHLEVGGSGRGGGSTLWSVWWMHRHNHGLIVALLSFYRLNKHKTDTHFSSTQQVMQDFFSPNNYQNAYVSLLNWEIFPVKFLATSPAESQLQQSCSIQSHCVLLTFSCVTVECLSLPTTMSESKTYIAQTAYHCATKAVE